MLFVLVLVEGAGGNRSDEEGRGEVVMVVLRKFGKKGGEGRVVLDDSETVGVEELVGLLSTVMVTVRSMVVVCVSGDGKECVAALLLGVTVTVMSPYTTVVVVVVCTS